MKESAITEKEALPKTTIVEENDWKVTIYCKGVFSNFVMCIAQTGDAKGSVTLEGPNDVKVSLGTKIDMCPFCFTHRAQLPINLSRTNEISSQIGLELQNKCNKKPNWKFLNTLLSKALAPYSI